MGNYIPNAEIEKLRQQLEERYGFTPQEKIKRVEWKNSGGNVLYIRADDRFEPPKPPEEKTEYLLHIMDGADTRILPFKSEQRLKAAFDSFKMLEQYGLAATVNGETKWKFTPK